ncbi:MAG TPA: hypothetical protein VG122_19590 [Gemmata sp.]|jgi:hypothetical protein|nr:hypothetical protein [Gemmata sp.]
MPSPGNALVGGYNTLYELDQLALPRVGARNCKTFMSFAVPGTLPESVSIMDALAAVVLRLNRLLNATGWQDLLDTP